MSVTSRTIVRMWNKDGYHKDVLTIDADQVRMHDSRVEDTKAWMLVAGTMGTRMLIDPSKFPEATCFEVIVSPYERLSR